MVVVVVVYALGSNCLLIAEILGVNGFADVLLAKTRRHFGM
jgi:hypothetical protein